jgi:hypothetical protein
MISIWRALISIGVVLVLYFLTIGIVVYREEIIAKIDSVFKKGKQWIKNITL